MGLAPFFDRARQSAAQVLRDFDPGAFERRLMDVVVTIAFDGHAAASAEGRAALDMVARIAARLYPRISIRSLGGEQPLASQLRALLLSINPNIELVHEIGSELHVAVVAGVTPFESDSSIYLGSDRWVAWLSTESPVGSGTSVNPFGAGASACIGMANVFRAVFSDRLIKPMLDTRVELSLLNFEVGGSALNGDLPDGLDLGLVQLVGVGAIGNAFIWAMSRLAGVGGCLHLIDHEPIELTNLQRYVLALMADLGTLKVERAATALSGSDIRFQCFPMKWADYVAGVGHHRFDRVSVALDTARDRLEVQSSLPRRIYNAWTQAGDLGVSRHAFDGDEACLACLYLPSGKRRNEDEIVAEELQLHGPVNTFRVREMLYFGHPVGEAFVREIAATIRADVQSLLPFAHLPLRAFRQKAICGNVIMRARDGATPDLEVPLAFQSALAGVMLAAEVVASTPGLRNVHPATRSVVDLMRPLPGRVSFPALKGGPGRARCICEDPDYLGAYRAKYGLDRDVASHPDVGSASPQPPSPDW